MKRNVALLTPLALLILSAGLAARPLSPESLAKVKAEGKLPEIVERLEDARARGFDQPGENILKTMRQLNRDQPGRDGVEIKVPVVLVDFDDNEANRDAHTADKYTTELFSQGEVNPGSMRDWYLENSNGEVDMTGETAGWYRAPENYSYYVDGQNGFGYYPQSAVGMAEAAIIAADDDIDYSQYDADGNGQVETVIVVHAGAGAEESGGDPDMIWSHANWFYETNIYLDGVTIAGYVTLPEECAIGGFAHELGHSLFGLPDLYDTDYSSEGLGMWSVMAAGGWAGDRGDCPTHFDAWCKQKLGFIHPIVAYWDLANLNIPPIQTKDAAYLLWDQGHYSSQYFLIENRTQTGFDAHIPGSGLLIYHIDESILHGWAPNDDEWYPGNQNNGHYGVALEQADGDWDLEKAANHGDEGDPFPGAAHAQTFDDNSTPNSLNYGSQSVSVSVSPITASRDYITCDIGVGREAPGPGVMWYDDGQGYAFKKTANYWSRVSFTSPERLGLSGVAFMPFNPGPSHNPCWVQVYREDAAHNLTDLLYDEELDELPQWNSDSVNADWVQVDIPQEDWPAFDYNENFSIIYGPAPGGAYDAQNVQEGDGWWHLYDRSTFAKRSYAATGNEPPADNGNWSRTAGDLLIRGITAIGAGKPADIVVTPDTLEFGEVHINSPLDQTLTISNIGSDDLTIDHIAIDPEGEFTVDYAGQIVLESFEERNIRVTFSPNDAGDRAATLTITSDDADEGEYTIHLTGVGLNAAPGVASPLADVVRNEDQGNFRIGDLNSVFEDPDREHLEYSVAAPEQLNISLILGHVMMMQPVANFNGTDLQVVVTASDGHNGGRALRMVSGGAARPSVPGRDASVTDTFLVTINPVNDAPTRFGLLEPASGTTIRRGEWEVFFDWEDAVDVDGTPLDYSLKLTIPLGRGDTTVVIDAGASSEFDLTRMDSLLMALEIYGAAKEDRVTLNWSVTASDGELTADSYMRWSLVIPKPLSAPGMERMPTDYALYPARPNPFNSATTIRYDTPANGTVLLAIFDVAGHRVALLSYGNLAAGYHQTIWSAADQPAGIYFCRMEAGGFRKTVKLAVVK